MRPWARPILTFLVCCLAFSTAYYAVTQASGQEGAVEQATPSATTATDELTNTPVETPAGYPSSLEDMGKLAPGGSVFDEWGVRVQMPDGVGDFRVIFPTIVDGPVTKDWDSNVIMTVYSINTRSSLFLGFDMDSGGTRVVERGRHVEQDTAQAVLDAIASSAEVSAR